jgi:hypothetical protein
MKPMLSGVWQKHNKSLNALWLIMAGFSALYFGAMKPYLGSRGIAAERVAGVASADLNPIAMWQAPLYDRVYEAGMNRVGEATKAVRMIADGSGEPRAPQVAMTTFQNKSHKRPTPTASWNEPLRWISSPKTLRIHLKRFVSLQNALADFW